MSIQKVDKLNLLYKYLPEGAVVSSKWLQSKGYSRQLIYKYVNSGWLKSTNSRGYYRPTTIITWKGIVASWQNISDNVYHVGGVTALNLAGFSHYLPLAGESQIYLFGNSKLPRWVSRLDFKEEFVYNRKNIFSSPLDNIGFKEFPSNILDWPLKVSSPERAIFEVLDTVCDEFSFIFAAELMEGLVTLRPKILMQFLEFCKSIRIKRLFLFLAFYYEHAWLKEINTKRANIGMGNRVIVDGGKLDKKYLITVPEQFYDRDEKFIF